MIFKGKVWKYQLFKEVSMTENEFMRGKLLDYYSTLNVEGVITELEMEDEMDRVTFYMTQHQIGRKYKQLKKMKDESYIISCFHSMSGLN